MSFLQPYSLAIFLTIGTTLLLLTIFSIFNKKTYFTVPNDVVSEKEQINLLLFNLLLFISLTISIKMIFQEEIKTMPSFLTTSLISLFISYWIIEISLRIFHSKYKELKKGSNPKNLYNFSELKLSSSSKTNHSHSYLLHFIIKQNQTTSNNVLKAANLPW